MVRAIWNGSISFGLVHLPVGLYSATRDASVDFQMLDKRSLDPVGYRRYNKRTGRELQAQDIVKGVRQSNGKYVVITDAEIQAAFPRSTRTIEIEAFIKLSDVPLMLLERPYYIAPAAKADKVYVLLREAMRAANAAAIARLVIHNKEHLALVIVDGAALVLDVLRWSQDVRSAGDLALPRTAAAIKPQERAMAERLVEEMMGPWQPNGHVEHFSAAINRLIRKKVAAGKEQELEPLEPVPERSTNNVVDLRELLEKSLRHDRGSRAGLHRRRSATHRATPRARRA